MNLIIDSGNTNVKIYEAKQMSIAAPHVFPKNNFNDIDEFLQNTHFNMAISSNVARSDQPWEKTIEEKGNKFIRFNKETPIPIKNAYKTPETLGYDRLAAAIGAAYMHQNQNILVIDFGTAITYDIVSDNTFLGGAIAPGMQIRFKSLHEYTSRLPLLEATHKFSIPGKTTKESILNGVIQGIKNEVIGTINSYQKEYSELITVITGGDMEFFAKIIKNGIFAEPKLIAKGLNNILNYNVEKS